MYIHPLWLYKKIFNPFFFWERKKTKDLQLIYTAQLWLVFCSYEISYYKEQLSFNYFYDQMIVHNNFRSMITIEYTLYLPFSLGTKLVHLSKKEIDWSQSWEEERRKTAHFQMMYRRALCSFICFEHLFHVLTFVLLMHLSTTAAAIVSYRERFQGKKKEEWLNFCFWCVLAAGEIYIMLLTNWNSI